MNNFWAMWYPIISFILLFIGVALFLYVSYFKLNEIESHLQNCPTIISNKKFWSGIGPHSRAQRLINASIVLRSHREWHEAEKPDMDEVRNFPTNLKRWVFYPFYYSYAFFLITIAGSIWEKWFLPA